MRDLTPGRRRALLLAGWIGLAAAAHVATVAAIPRYVTWKTLAAREVPANEFTVRGFRTAPADRVPYSNSYNLSAFMVYDLADGPVRVRAEVPRGLPYWSIGAHAYDTDQIFLANDRDLPQGRIELLIVREGEPAAAVPGVHVVRSPSRVGMVIIRSLLPVMDPAAMGRLQEELRRTITVSRGAP